VRVEPSELSLAEKDPLASVATGGTSLRPRRRALNESPSSFAAASARLHAGASSAADSILFVYMSIPLYADFARILERLCGAEVPSWNSRPEFNLALRPYGDVSYLSNQDCVTGSSVCCQIAITAKLDRHLARMALAAAPLIQAPPAMAH
jgi:hypothetical protein